jgi:hypothetical protein
MMQALTLLHRWLGIAFCLLFAMWFATGIVMHFVAFPALTETERFAGLAPIDSARIDRSPAQARTASGIKGATRVRLLQRSDGPVYVVSGGSRVKALRASDLADATVRSAQLAVAIAVDDARRSGMDAAHATFAALAPYDQWTVPDGFDLHRPLYRIALNDDAGTALYVSSATGEVVLDTTRRERGWNFAGSVMHWIYPTALRRHGAAWDVTVWWLSLGAMIAAMSGAVLGVIRIKPTQGRLMSRYRGWHAWHHALGLISMTFILTWIFSGWLSMDNGRLFSRGQVTDEEATAVTGAPAWDALPTDEPRRIGAQAMEVEWFAFDGQIYRRERTSLRHQRLVRVVPRDDSPASRPAFLRTDDLRAVARRLAPTCSDAIVVDAADNYAIASAMPGAPVYRLVCGDVWYHIDGATGALLEKLDPSRRAYRWLYSALHTFDIPALTARPVLRTVLIVLLCGLGFAFSLTGVVIGWRRLRWSVAPAADQAG